MKLSYAQLKFVRSFLEAHPATDKPVEDIVHMLENSSAFYLIALQEYTESVHAHYGEEFTRYVEYYKPQGIEELRKYKEQVTEVPVKVSVPLAAVTQEDNNRRTEDVVNPPHQPLESVETKVESVVTPTQSIPESNVPTKSNKMPTSASKFAQVKEVVGEEAHRIWANYKRPLLLGGLLMVVYLLYILYKRWAAPDLLDTEIARNYFNPFIFECHSFGVTVLIF